MIVALSGRRATAAFRAGLGLVALSLLVGCGRGERRAASERPLRVALHSAPLSLDPHAENEIGTFSFLSNICEGLTGFDQNLRIRGVLAQSWENPDALTWRFHLRHGVRFQDGRPLTAADVVYSLDRVAHSPASGMRSYLVEVSRVKALSIDTVEIVTRRPYPILLNKLAFALIVPKGWPKGDQPPMGTGPYRFAGRLPGGGLELVANDLYWRGRPPIKKIEVYHVPDELSRVHELESGVVDFIDQVAPASIRPLERAGLNVVTAPGRLVMYIELNVTRPPFSDLRVRQAVNLAIDRGQLVRNVLDGMGRPANQMVDRDVFGFDSNLPKIEPDLPKARKLLAAAGYPHGFSVTLNSNFPAAANAVKRQLARVGIEITVTRSPGPQTFRALRKLEVTMYLAGVFAPTADASDLFDAKIHTRDPESGYGGGNYSGYSNPILDQLIERTATTEGMEQRRAALEQSMKIIVRDLPMIPLYVGRDVSAANADLYFKPRLDERLDFFEMRW